MAKSAGASAGSPSSKSLMFMMIAMTAGVCVLLGGGLLLTSRIIHALTLRNSSDKSTVRTPIGDYRTEKAQQVGPGLPIYPQASLILPGADSEQVAEAPSNQPQVVSSVYHVNAARDFVANWYAEHLSPEFVRQESAKSLPEILHSARISDDDVAFLGERGEQIRAVVLKAEDTGTRIMLLRSTAPSTAQNSTSK